VRGKRPWEKGRGDDLLGKMNNSQNRNDAAHHAVKGQWRRKKKQRTGEKNEPAASLEREKTQLREEKRERI